MTGDEPLSKTDSLFFSLLEEFTFVLPTVLPTVFSNIESLLLVSVETFDSSKSASLIVAVAI